ncbi:YdbH domain-containing protein [Paraglaciecola sp. L1A13]|uniref:intermembrane phospholipid transport protein YdbH family protein n=1 Tax=Paraglaciecola sp. L1A13 TaxID=2686359 RepID=UPI00131EAA47|nr:YdbH domain-containing protein [Paraglaciecola sp. L1A13]
MGILLSKKRFYVPFVIFLFVVISLFLTYVFRQSVATLAIETFAKEQNIRVECLTFDIDWQFNVTIQKACITLHNLTIQLNNAHFMRVKNQLSISSLRVKHEISANIAEKPTSTISNFDLASWQLPSALPLLNIQSVHIESALLSAPLKFELSQPSSNSLLIEGDFNATLELRNIKDKDQTLIIADVDWSLDKASSYFKQNLSSLHSLQTLLTQRQLMDAPISTHIKFDGTQLNSWHKLDVNFDYQFDKCEINTHVSGKIFGDISLASQELVLDLSQSAIVLMPKQGCYTVMPTLPYTLPNKFELASPAPIIINSEQVNTSKFSVRSLTPNMSADFEQLSIQLPSEKKNPAVSSTVSVQTELLHSADKLLATGNNTDIQLGATQIPNTSVADPQSLLINIVGNLHWNADNWGLEGIKSEIKVDRFIDYGINAKLIEGEITGDISSNSGISISANLKAQGTKYTLQTSARDATTQTENGLSQTTAVPTKSKVITTKALSSSLEVTGENFKQLTLSVNSTLYQIKIDDILINKLTNNLQGSVIDLNKVSLVGGSILSGIALNLENDQYLTLSEVDVSHKLNAQREANILTSHHQVVVDNTFNFSIEQKEQVLGLTLNRQALSGLQPAISRFMPALILQNGTLELDGQYQLKDATFEGSFTLADVVLKYQEFNINNLSTSGSLQLNSAGLQLPKTTLNIESADTGVPIEHVNMQYYVQNNVAKVEQVTGKVLGGKFALDKLWLDKRDQQAQITVENIDLAQVVDLQKQAGINVTGSVGGILPMIVQNEQFYIDGGLLKSQGPGTLKINGNPAFDSIAEQQTELNYLKNLKFKQLSSQVKLNPDGLLFLDFSILGQNANQQQEVNFNYHHEENILTLLRSLRLTDSVQNQIEQKIKKGDKK